MRVTAELSLYPLEADYIPRIEKAIAALRASAGLEIVVNQMSTQLRGELPAVLAAMESLMNATFADGTPQSLVAKILNSDLPIGESPAV